MLGFKYFLHKWINKEITVNGIIPWDSFRSNVKNTLKTIFNQTKKSEQIAIFSSGGTISSIVGESLEISKESIIADLNFSVRNTSFSTFFYSNNEFNLMSFNELPHLKEDMVTFV
jgi:broad specificity phosphatase PhoE